jgi:hypothetical protein
VADAASPREVVFGVYADYGPRAVPTTGDPFGGCGDFELDYGIQCVNVCTPQFEPGVDGAYYVMIPSGTGHIHTGGSVPECTDGADNDGDGRTDFPDDPGCIGPMDDAESPEVLASECSDGLDNDLDGRVDFPADPGCADTADDTESPDPACGDRVDNDGDGRIDYPADPRCADARDTSEGPDPQCDDGRDNDGDGKADYPADYGCSSLDDDSEGPNPQCSDGIDNDNHGQIDYPDDPQCDNPYDDSELEDPDCSDGVDNDGDGKTDFPNDPGCSSPSDNNETDPCGNDFLSTVSTGSTNTGAVDIYFKVGSGRTLTKERVWHSGGPSPNPNPISHTYHSGTGGGSEHDWTVGASSDYKTRQFSYEFQTYGCGVYKTYSGYFYIYN